MSDGRQPTANSANSELGLKDRSRAHLGTMQTVRLVDRGLLGPEGLVSCVTVSRSGSPKCLVASGTIVSEYDLPTLSVTAQAVLPSPVVHVLLLEATKAAVCFTEAGMISILVNASGNSLFPLSMTGLPGAAARVSFVASSPTRPMLAFVKKDSPSVWCAELNVSTAVAADAFKFFKLRSNIDGDQSKRPNILKTGIASVRGAVSNKKADQSSSVTQLIAHTKRPYLAAGYQNGMVRVWEFQEKSIKVEMDVQLLRGETLVSIVFHATEEILLAATNTGRIASFRFRGATHARGSAPLPPVSRHASKSYLQDLFLWTPAMSASADKSQNSPYILGVTAYGNEVLVRKVDSLTGKVFRSTVYPSNMHMSQDPPQSSPSPGLSLTLEPITGLAVLFEHNKRTASLREQVEFGQSNYRTKLTQGPGIVAAVETPFSIEPGAALEGKVTVHPHAMFVAGSSAFLYQLVDHKILEVAKNLPSGLRRDIKVAYDGIKGEMMAAIVCIHAEDSDTDGQNDNSAAYMGEENWRWKYILLTRKGDTTSTEQWSTSDLQDGRDAFFLGSPGSQDSILVLSPLGTSIAIVSFGPKRSAGRGVQRIKLPERMAVRRVFPTPLGNYQALVYWEETENFLALSRNAQYQTGTDSDYELDISTKVTMKPTEAVFDIRWQEMPGNRQNSPEFLGFILTNRRLLFFRDDLQPLGQFDLSLHLQSENPLVNPSALWMGPIVVLGIGSSVLGIDVEGRAELLCRLSQADGAAVLVSALPDRIIYLRYPSNPQNQFCVNTKPIGSLALLLRGFLALPTTNSGSQYASKIRFIMESRDVHHASAGLLRSMIAFGLTALAKVVVIDRNAIAAPVETAQILTEMDSLKEALELLEEQYQKLSSEDSFHDGSELFRAFQSLCNHAFSVNDFTVASRCAHILGREGTLRAFLDREGGFEAIQVLSRYASKGKNQPLSDRLEFLRKRSEASSIATLDFMADFPGNSIPQTIADGIELGQKETCQIFVETKDSGLIQVPPMSITSVLETLVCEKIEQFVSLRADDEVADETFTAVPVEDEESSVPVVESNSYPDEIDHGLQTSEDRESNNAVQTLRADMLRVFELIDNRQMDTAETLLRSCVDLLPQVEDSKPMQVVIRYLFFVRVLGFIASGKANLATALSREQVNPSQLLAARIRLAHLGNTLTEIPFIIDRHRVRAILLTVGLHMDISNFGTAARGVQLVQAQAPPEKARDLQAVLATCTSNGFRDQNPVPPNINTCFDSFSAFHGRGGRCRHCPAVFSPTIVGSKFGGPGSQCSYCRIGVVD